MKLRTVLGCPACPATHNVAYWFALDEDTYDGPGSDLGSGESEEEAIADLREQMDLCVFCGRKITWADDAEIDEQTELICFDCDRQRDDARRDEALGL